MNTQDISAIKQLLSKQKNIVIVPHKNPDGDAIGSSLSLLHYFLKINQKVTIISPNDYPLFFKWLPLEDSILIYENTPDLCKNLINKADLIFTLDFNALHRAGELQFILEESEAIKIMIDHHQQPDNYATYIYSDVTMSSTCEMVYHFLDKLNSLEYIDETIATCLYLGIMTDTGSFRYRSTTSTTHRVISNLIDKGANNTKIHNHIYDTNSFNRIQLLGIALNNLRVIPESRTAYLSLSQLELNKFDYKKGDTEGFVNYALSLNNIILAAIFIEDKQNHIIKISLRSKGQFSVNELSREYFQGGGHNNAAGGKSDLSLEATIEKFISILPVYKNALNDA